MFFFGQNVLASNQPYVSCTFVMTVVPDAIEAYAKQNGGKMPDADKWQDQIAPFYSDIVKNRTDIGPIKVLKPEEEWVCNAENPRTTIAYNSEVSGQMIGRVQTKPETILLFESSATGRNVHAKYTPQPFDRSPKLSVFGQTDNRGWLLATVGGDTFLQTKSGKQAVSAGGN